MKWCLLFRIAATNDYVYIFEFEKNSKKEAAILSGEIIHEIIKPIVERNKSSYNSLFLVEKKELNSFLQQNF
ncbi:MAG: hypothetical protein US83_C0004G0058 [Candidatus Falkowbacteria bacterium GW2011_GWC2_38_22]|uniref:Uncharacterized protein n=1 Tax=Candidatus Falkowbacteria bacterium GW2011_GWE1_38_31 TaxID=1618638 RepID=A0A0G0MA38_9BACT|nr:MAG: hypothetical protein US73_C0002G0059 [Candidatus Falkowbacteria bacterium GW2011_GWF2_38_1205]KKQ61674.1 MAG: hypothetical protein US83_C0004G0058 [Candidatus Falkowbacteria bacterium GW2011_GWC2_38_22]KKQ63711.1 MAG: hypothetical protein US84_C0004G0059 [Candidatus Falkowbacteria bacterium GW2011_GWF1_38_22]KKQ65873.1 MAG: hypothetical protein US87_C0004G0058 [Candidatus Falkowbacteria bacterium GW2011_GWE2_38_254]KKQ70574.1 MAG: hypothetical protein US91_C0004G0059 [Candidatus Falkowb